MSSNGLLASHDVCAFANPDSSFFIRKSDPLVIENLVANGITCDTINLNEGILTCIANGSTLTLNGVPVGGGGGSGTVQSVAVASPLTISGDPNVNPTIGINLSSIVQTNTTQLITGAKKFAILPQSVIGVVPTDPDEFTNKLYVDTKVASVSSIVGGLSSITDWALYPAIANVSLANFALTNVSSIQTPLISAPSGLNINTGASPLVINTTNIDLNQASLIDASSLIGNQLQVVSDTSLNVSANFGNVEIQATQGVVSLNGTAIDFNGKPLTNVGDIQHNEALSETPSLFSITSAVATTITAGLALNLAAANVNIGSLGLPILGGINLAATGAINIGSANYTSIENVRITNSIIEKEPSTADLQLNDIAVLKNDLANLVIGTNTITIAPNGTTTINTNNQNYLVSSGDGQNSFAGQFINMAATSSIVMECAAGTNNPIEIRVPVPNNLSVSETAYDATTDPSSVLDVRSATRGMYLPRLTTVARNAIPQSQKGLIVYDTNVSSIMNYDGSNWSKPALTNESNELLGNLSGKVSGTATRTLTGFNTVETATVKADVIEPVDPLVQPFVGIAADVSMLGNTSLSFGLVGGGDGTISVPNGTLNMNATTNFTEAIQADGVYGPVGYVLASSGSSSPPMWLPFVGGPIGGRLTLGAVFGETIVPATSLTWDSGTGVLV